MSLFQSSSGNQEKAKADFDVCQAGHGENILVSMTKDLERSKAGS